MASDQEFTAMDNHLISELSPIYPSSHGAWDSQFSSDIMLIIRVNDNALHTQYYQMPLQIQMDQHWLILLLIYLHNGRGPTPFPSWETNIQGNVPSDRLEIIFTEKEFKKVQIWQNTAGRTVWRTL